jgi:hypothetical protein
VLVQQRHLGGGLGAYKCGQFGEKTQEVHDAVELRGRRARVRAHEVKVLWRKKDLRIRSTKCHSKLLFFCLGEEKPSAIGNGVICFKLIATMHLRALGAKQQLVRQHLVKQRDELRAQIAAQRARREYVLALRDRNNDG